ncbi:hypothetical protein GCM10008085_10760 [Winogradskyella epiphytica]|uniref:hypothetical protein n=1 Tax=Winogradskyella epiphytica TaxID=262005 RepID=UPI000D7CB73B|nr:hypothetical protein [Winogradskyella epiphytica]GGW61069.1 hypothetical protein GCM10008085_10760 [Winogradskyella epiphytica]
MKLTKIFILTIGFITLIGCGTNDQKNNLIGIWESYETHHTKVALTFYKDSVSTESFGGEMRTNSKWKVDESKIYLKQVQHKDIILKNNLNYEYELNKTKDTMWIKVDNGTVNEFTTMKKVTENPFTSEL